MAQCYQHHATSNQVDIKGIKMTESDCKACTYCGKVKPLDKFEKSKGECRTCRNHKAKIRMRKLRESDAYREKGREYARQRTVECRQEERARAAAARGKTYTPREKHPLSGLYEKPQRKLAKSNARQAWRHWLKVRAPNEWLEQYYSDAPWANCRLSGSERYAVRYRHDESFAVKERLRRQITKHAKRDGIADSIRSAINGSGKSNAVERALGYTVQEFMDHMERQFSTGMSWDRFKSGEIHIDHVRPQASFDLTDDGEWLDCWSLPNLRPCWARENLRKSNKEVFLL